MKAKKRSQIDPRIEDLRKKILYLSPYTGWIPKGVKNRIVNITDFDGEVIGELEMGSDGFVQLIVNIPGKDVAVIKVEFYPGRDHAKAYTQ